MLFVLRRSRFAVDFLFRFASSMDPPAAKRTRTRESKEARTEGSSDNTLDVEVYGVDIARPVVEKLRIQATTGESDTKAITAVKDESADTAIANTVVQSTSAVQRCDLHLLANAALAQQILDLELEQTLALRALSFGPHIATVYHPVDYASEPHSDYVRRYCRSPKTVVFVGMNPGPFGMVQSGVPFGDCRMAKQWLRISGRVRKPLNENAKRPIVGLDCERSEVSGNRFWSFVRSLAANDEPNSFFQRCYVHNYCPAAFLDAKGKNVTPASFKKADLVGLEAVCDEYLLKAVRLLQASIVVGIGTYAYERCRRVFLNSANRQQNGIRVEMIMHPSPANPAANTGGGWAVKVREQLEQLDLLRYMGVGE